MNAQLVEIAGKLRDYFLVSSSMADVSIFLCGGAGRSDGDVRRGLGDAISALKSKYRYSVHYPEDIFIELVLGHQRQDLLTLENLLARSVSAVVLLLQSPGTFTELGAFSNHDLLKDKLVVVVDPRYKKAQSFINVGPLRYLAKETSSHVLFLEMANANLSALVKAVGEASRAIAVAHPPKRDLTNPIACYGLYLALLYVLDPVPRVSFAELARTLQPDDRNLVATVAETVANGLVNNGDALLVSQHLHLSRKGVDTLFASAGSARRLARLKDMLWDQRIRGLNGTLRKRYKNFWGEAA
ncbi:MAG: retron St85 family effector protein [Candidatus Marinimicrobia bacterium]|nr:retron St85 family effector protein [Candidatus Neomarinimicrobiota bacterium]